MSTQRVGSTHPRAVMAVLCSIGVVAALQGTLLVPLMSRLPEIYGVSAVRASWIITSTLLAGALATPIISRLADIYGKRRMVLVTLAALVVGSLLLATMDSYLFAVVGRSLQGFAAALVPVGISIIRDVMPPARVGRGIALMSATLGIGSAVGLPLAGFLYVQLGWASIFWLSAFTGALLGAATWILLPESSPGTKERFDWPGSVLFVLALTPLVLVIAQGNEWGWFSTPVLSLAAVGVVAVLVLVPLELRLPNPLVHVRTLASRPVALTNIATIVVAMAMVINLYLAAQQLAVPAGVPGGLGFSADLTGLLMGIPAGALAAVSPAVGRMLTRYGGRRVLIAGALIMGVSYVSRVFLDETGFQVVLGAVLVCIGTSLALSAQTMIIMEVVPPEQTASANGINTLCRMLGTALSTAALAALTAVSSTTFGGHEYPTTQTFHLAFWACACFTIVSAVMIALVPRTPQRRLAGGLVGS